MESPYVNILTSFINPVALSLYIDYEQISSRSTLKNKNRTGDIQDPYRIPIVTFIFPDVNPLIMSIIIRSFKKEPIYDTANLEIFL